MAPNVVPPSVETSFVQSIGDAARWLASVPPAVLITTERPPTVADTAVPKVRLPARLLPITASQ